MGLDLKLPDEGSPADVHIVKHDVVEDIGQGLDVQRPDGLTGLFGDPCDENADCISGYCILDPDTGETVCTSTCVLECPDDWECRAVVGTWPDVVSICVPPSNSLCEPCELEVGCENPADLCLPIGEDVEQANFCARGCVVSGECPPGYTCTDIEDESGQIYSQQCLPDTGSCVCTAELDGTTRTCEVGNEYGTCYGTELCEGPRGWGECTAATPAVEICDGDDNDCDGAFDEGFDWADPSGATLSVGDSCGTGACAGIVACADMSSATCSGLPNESIETCNLIDDDCDGETDEEDDCPTAGCSGSIDDYVESGDTECVNGACVAPDAVGCGLYTCYGGGDSGDTCAHNCFDDSWCIEGAHCEEARRRCELDVVDGGSCAEASDCISGHCQNGFCCASGDCCGEALDCPATYFELSVCDDAATCQGQRVDAQCVNSTCARGPGTDDDSACTGGVFALDCAPYVPVYCDGALEQQVPVCPTDCVDDAMCLPGLHCDGVCVPNVGDGQACDEASDCVSGHCQNGFCCTEGSCCGSANDCPDVFSVEPVCDDPSTCQGHRIEATCVQHICGNSPDIHDDTACDEGVRSDDCGQYADVYCTGAYTQTSPACDLGCAADDVCDLSAHCDDGVCIPDLGDGNACDEDSDCASGHCENGFCCASGDCCALIVDCPASYTQVPLCDDEPACQGSRVDATCESSICGTITVADDTACDASVTALDCELTADVLCTGESDQAVPSCLGDCTTDEDCDETAHCDDGDCVQDDVDGSGCDEDSDCVSGHCVGGVCCAEGDCCLVPSDCPASYVEVAVCDDPSTCQGHRVDAGCVDFVCDSFDVDDDEACGVDVLSDECGFFLPVFCGGVSNQSDPACPAGCEGDADCDAGAHCDGGYCVSDTGDGQPCNEDSDCVSGHCQNNFCCTSGDCCSVADNCPTDEYREPPMCDDGSLCQGHRVDATCVDSICGTTDVDDDSGCDESVAAAGCGLFADVFCTGTFDQGEPVCDTACIDDFDCDQEAHCDDGLCLSDLPDGAACDEDGDCVGGHCQNGFCCSAGDCCASPGDCPVSFREDAVCDSAVACQGHRVDATCVVSMCGSDQVDDDSACGGDLLSAECGLFQAVYCSGEGDQDIPACPTFCAVDEDCDDGSHCDGVCVADLINGQPCDEDSDCESLHCQNGRCCVNGDCCALAGDCPATYQSSAQCDEPATCQGHRIEAACEDYQCDSVDINDDGACDEATLSDDCGLFPSVYCTGAFDQNDPFCSDSCLYDHECDAAAHCDGGACVSDLPDGSSCDENSDCIANHCENGFCCAGGVCCGEPIHCTAEFSAPALCDDPTGCQGFRVDATCVAHICGSTAELPDDGACTDQVESSDCGPFPSVFCNGAEQQLAPLCEMLCADDVDCDPGAHCVEDGTCVFDLGDGSPCVEDSDCVSGHCQNGFCCGSGDCCSELADCPADYDVAPWCPTPRYCEGFRGDAVCEDSECATSQVEDDSACDETTVALSCDPYPPAFCNGDVDQTQPDCATGCADDADCGVGAHCDDGECWPDLDNGRRCDEDSDCAGGHCDNGYCCVSGVCCYGAGSCPGDFRSPATCDDHPVCQGYREDATCEDYVCGTVDVEDDTACHGGIIADNCGYFLPVFCDGSDDQSAPSCPGSCADDSDCDGGAHCDEGVCVADLGAGSPCDGDGDCAGNLYCVDGVCCTSAACPGVCQRCDAGPSPGSCGFVAIDTDPDEECGALSCLGYYAGWDVAGCHRRGDVLSTEAFCNGAGGCDTAEELCPMQDSGPLVLATCHSDCQQAGGCAGEVPGSCTDTNGLGFWTCGQGNCAAQVPRCVDGEDTLESSCVPGVGEAELCNTEDDDCDGDTDEDFPDKGLSCDGDDIGVCATGIFGCTDDGLALVCEGDDDASVEACNNADDDCDGETDEDLGFETCGLGVCEHTISLCEVGVPQTCDPFEGASTDDEPDVGGGGLELRRHRR